MFSKLRDLIGSNNIDTPIYLTKNKNKCIAYIYLDGVIVYEEEETFDYINLESIICKKHEFLDLIDKTIDFTKCEKDNDPFNFDFEIINSTSVLKKLFVQHINLNSGENSFTNPISINSEFKTVSIFDNNIVTTNGHCIKISAINKIGKFDELISLDFTGFLNIFLNESTSKSEKKITGSSLFGQKDYFNKKRIKLKINDNLTKDTLSIDYNGLEYIFIPVQNKLLSPDKITHSFNVNYSHQFFFSKKQMITYLEKISKQENIEFDESNEFIELFITKDKLKVRRYDFIKEFEESKSYKLKCKSNFDRQLVLNFNNLLKVLKDINQTNDLINIQVDESLNRIRIIDNLNSPYPTIYILSLTTLTK